MKRTSLPKAAGVLTIISGALEVIGAVPIGWLVRGVVGFGTSGAVMIPITAVAIPLALIGAFALLGGRASFRRENYRLALTGAVCAIIFLLGIPAIILLLLSRKEFHKAQNL